MREMNPFQVKILIQPDGERLPIVLRRSTGLPVDILNQYLLYVLRSRSASSTLKKYLDTLTLLFWWGETRKIDMKDRLLSGEGFTSDEILVGIKDFLRMDLSAGGDGVVAPETLTGRVGVIKNFVSYHIESAIMRLPSDDARIDRMTAKKVAIDNAFDRLTGEKSYSETRYALSEKASELLLEISDHRSPANPWKPRCRSRNRLIVQLLLSTAMRRGELLKTCVADCEINSATPAIRIVRTPDNPIDPRKDDPKAKTNARLISIPPELARAIDDYIQNERYRISNSHKTPFLFLNVKNGKPLSLRQLNRIFEQIRLRHPEKIKSLYPHILRHTVLTQIRKGLKTAGYAEDNIKGHLKSYAGWETDNSGTYTAAAIEAECNSHLREYQNKLFSRTKDVPF